MHENQTKHTPLWYCVFDKNDFTVKLMDKTEPGGAKCTDNTSEQSLAETIDKVTSDDRDDFIAKLNAKGVIFNETDVKL